VLSAFNFEIRTATSPKKIAVRNEPETQTKMANIA